MRRGAGLLALVLALGLGGCGPRAVRWEAPAIYEVRRGDTLYAIAFRHGLDHRAVARWNGIRAPYRIVPGQRLSLRAPAAHAGRVATTGTTRPPRATPPASSAPAARLAWSWPADGPLLSGFRPGVATARGLDLGGARGAAVRAAADGRVVYAGSGLVGFGKVIILKHDERWLSAYAHLDAFEVREETAVRKGQRIAGMGLGPGQRPTLHFEIRLDGQPVDPLPLLPRR